jgi:hypothetical protein
MSARRDNRNSRSRLRLPSGSWWPVGSAHHRHEGLAFHLRRTARVNARRALRTFGNDDVDDQLLAAVSAGCAVELLTKALIATTSPALLTERADRDSLLHLTDHGHLARRSVTEVRTLSATDAVATAIHLHPGLAWHKERDEIVFRVRNAAAHMALVDSGELSAAIIVMIKYIHSLLAVQSSDAGEFWGSDLAPLAAELLDEAKSQTARVVAAKLAAARSSLEALVGRLGEDTRAVVLASLSGRKPESEEHDEAQTCPVCDQQGWLLCGIHRGDVQWNESGEPYLAPYAFAVGFVCGVCGLALWHDELDEFSFPSEIELDHERVEPDWEPDEDTERGR